MELIAFISKWLHLLSIAGILGGIAFALIALVPVLRTEPESAALKQIWKRFGITMAILWLVALATGFYNLSVVTPTVNGTYQMWVGIKIALALAMFLGTMLLAHPFPAIARFFKEKGAWLALLLLLAILIVGISAKLNISRVNGAWLKKPAAAAMPVNPPAAP